MKKILSLIVILVSLQFTYSQELDKLDKETIESLKKNLLKNTSEQCCKCIDSISIVRKIKSDIADEINYCIDKRIDFYSLATKLVDVSQQDDSLGGKVINMSFDMDKNSKEYKTYYYEIERYLMANCKAIKEKIGSNEITNEKSVSEISSALDEYNLGLKASEKEDYKNAIKHYKEAVKIDPEFAFAFDNLGICYRKIGKYEEAIEAYKKSLKIDPYGITPLQNIAVAYQYTKEYDKSIDAYKKLAELDPENPEVFYGIGQVYFTYLKDNEKGLDNMCKAYNLYIEQNSPYRTDAETIIQYIYAAMNKEGKKDKFIEILEKNKIKTN
jgi:tetratricopeptide (TPR) repeat protein